MSEKSEAANRHAKWRRDYEEKRAELAEVLEGGAILQGSAVEQRYKRKTKSGLKECGPYHLWTRKKRGKTVTVSLTSEQHREVGEAIATRRRIEVLLKEMQQLSEQMLLDEPRPE